MFALSKRTARSSLHALRRKVALEALSNLQLILLLQMVVGISDTVNGSVARSRVLARTLLLSGQRRLQDLLAAAPRLQLPVEQVLAFCHSGESENTPEEAAAQALIELCLGLMLQWMAEGARRQRTSVVPRKRCRVSLVCFPPCPSQRPPRTRACPYLPLT